MTNPHSNPSKNALAAEARWRVDIPASSPHVAPHRVTIPLPQGHDAVESFCVQGPDGRRRSAQARTLVSWPDGSPRWVQLDFPADRAGTHLITPGVAEGPGLPVIQQASGAEFAVRVGRLQARFDSQSGSPLAGLSWCGRLLTDAVPATFVAVAEDGSEYALAAAPESGLRVEASGPQRLQAAWNLQHLDAAGDCLLTVRIRIEFLANVEGFSLSYQFFHVRPGRPMLRLRELRARVALAGMTADGRAVVCQHAYGDIGLSRFARLRRPVTLHLDRTRYTPYVRDAAELDDDLEYPPFLEGMNLSVGHAVALESADLAMTFVQRDFDRQRPKTLTVGPGFVEVGIWPAEAAVLELPQGRSNRQVFAFRFAPADSDRVDAALAAPDGCDVDARPAWLHPADAAAGGESWDPPRVLRDDAEGAALFSHLLSSATRNWQSVAEMFHYGDVPDPGYAVVYAATGRAKTDDPEPRSYTFADDGRSVHGQFTHSRDLPKVWTNNEYDVIYCLALEASRTQSPAVLRKLKAAARHQIEVDFVHYHDHWQQHRSTPAHSYDHVAGCASIASHQWTQGLYHYYVLTGDDDVPDAVRGICEFNIQFMNRPELQPFMYFNRELGWALIALVFGYELTAEPRYIAAARDVLEKLQQDASRTDFDDLRTASRSSMPQNIATIGGDFGSNTILLGLKVYYQATGEPWAHDLLQDWVALGLRNFNDKASGVKISELFLETLCYACETSGDPVPLRDSLWHLRLFLRGFNDMGWVHRTDMPLSTKQYARIYRGLSHYLAALAAADLLQAEERRLID